MLGVVVGLATSLFSVAQSPPALILFSAFACLVVVIMVVNAGVFGTRITVQENGLSCAPWFGSAVTLRWNDIEGLLLEGMYGLPVLIHVVGRVNAAHFALGQKRFSALANSSADEFVRTFRAWHSS